MIEPGAAPAATARSLCAQPEPHPSRPRVLLLGEGAGVEVVVEFALRLSGRSDAPWRPLVLLGAAGHFAFRPRPSTVLVPGMPPGVIACLPRLDAVSVPSRLASAADLPGCFEGSVVELADLWLAALSRPELAQTALYVCGPGSLAQAATALATRRGLPCLTLPEPVPEPVPVPVPAPDVPLSRS